MKVSTVIKISVNSCAGIATRTEIGTVSALFSDLSHARKLLSGMRGKTGNKDQDKERSYLSHSESKNWKADS
jgi:hypothetical protein